MPHPVRHHLEIYLVAFNGRDPLLNRPETDLKTACFVAGQFPDDIAKSFPQAVPVKTPEYPKAKLA
jgi:hypothetical protein